MPHVVTRKAPGLGPDSPGIIGPNQVQDHAEGYGRLFAALADRAEKDQVSPQFLPDLGDMIRVEKAQRANAVAGHKGDNRLLRSHLQPSGLEVLFKILSERKVDTVRTLAQILYRKDSDLLSHGCG